MSMKCRAGWLLSLILAVLLGAMTWKFIIAGQTVRADDGRTVVLLTADERNKVLGEMRGLLETVQGIAQAAADGDLAEAERLARASGMAAAKGEGAIIRKLPLDFKTLGLGTHQAFDDLADFIAGTDDPLAVVGELGSLMGNCTGCHASYRLGIEGRDEAGALAK